MKDLIQHFNYIKLLEKEYKKLKHIFYYLISLNKDMEIELEMEKRISLLKI